jgi:20S proteasome alpha/beta subunit
VLLKFFCSYGGHIGAYLIVAGVDVDGPHLVNVSNHGNLDVVNFTTFVFQINFLYFLVEWEVEDMLL